MALPNTHEENGDYTCRSANEIKLNGFLLKSNRTPVMK